MNIQEKVKTIIENLRPYIKQDGGDLEFVDLKNNIVYIRLLGACIGCGLADITVKNGIEEIIKEEIPEIISVEVVL